MSPAAVAAGAVFDWIIVIFGDQEVPLQPE
jgi:hypothetical protein